LMVYEHRSAATVATAIFGAGCCCCCHLIREWTVQLSACSDGLVAAVNFPPPVTPQRKGRFCVPSAVLSHTLWFGATETTGRIDWGTPAEPEPEPEAEPEAGNWSQHVVAIHPPPGAVRYPKGTEVYAQLKAGAGSQGWARAVVIDAADRTTTLPVAFEGDPGDRHTVRVLDGVGPSFKRRHAGMELEVPTPRLIMVPTDTRLVIAAETADYRRLSRAFATPTDFVVDIGCSYGEGTKLIAAQCPHVLGLELVSSVVEQARHRHPHIRFEQLDCLAATPAGT
jgi:hypothetical protein